MLTKVFFSDMTDDNNLQNLLKLTCSEATLPSDIDELCLMNNMSLSKNSQQKELYDHQLE